MANTPYVIEDGDFQTTTLNGAIINVANTATIGTGLTIPATNGVLQIDYDSTEALGDANGPETVSYATYNSGTGALTGMTRGLAGTTGVSHANGRSVQYGPSSLVLQGLQDGTSIDINIGARAYASAAQNNITTATATKVVLGTENYDLGGNFASSKFTVPAGGGGTYDVKGAVFLTSMEAAKYMQAMIYVNGAVVATGITSEATAGGYGTSFVADTLRLAATDYVELYVYTSTTGNAADILTGTGNTYMAVQYLGS
jgi:hypothetical protein